MSLTSDQEFLCCLGQPVAGNPTQYMMEKAFEAAGLDWRYLTCEVPPEKLADAMRGLRALGFNTGPSESPITPVIAGDGALAMKLSDRLFQEGVFAQGIAFPTVARDKARVRTIVTATHTRDELQFALDVFAKVGGELGILL